eukprot:TRINITY_DN6949_c0_g1_i16.p1 TRINITY_DN6949_c0_g1~~TRINITY_DN6949_c0_g1_i16.p1  ORF type:complete len:572 (+),score=100.44 TRINITY_DN6949_c0_g1_i16:722-2437(+)
MATELHNMEATVTELYLPNEVILSKGMQGNCFLSCEDYQQCRDFHDVESRESFLFCGQIYIHSSKFFEEKEDSDNEGEEMPSGRGLAIVWDCSFSRKCGVSWLEQDITLVEDIVENETFRNTCSYVDIFLVGVSCERKRFQPNEYHKVVQFLEEGDFGYLGGTRYENIPFSGEFVIGAPLPGSDPYKELQSVIVDGQSKYRGEYNYSCWLTFTDGINTLGEKHFIPNSFSAPVYAYSCKDPKNDSLLKKWCFKSGGKYLNSEGQKEDLVEDIIKFYRNPNLNSKEVPSFLYAQYDSEIIREVMPGNKKKLEKVSKGNDRSYYFFTVMGILHRIPSSDSVPEITLTLNFGVNNNVTYSHNLQIHQKSGFVHDFLDSVLLSQLWAKMKVDYITLMEDDQGKKEQEILKIGKVFNLVTEYSSLIILENLEQYIEHEIIPPRSLTEIFQKYIAVMSSKKDQTRNSIESKILSQVHPTWERKIRLWSNELLVSGALTNRFQILHFMSVQDELKNTFNKPFFEGNMSEFETAKYSHKHSLSIQVDRNEKPLKKQKKKKKKKKKVLCVDTTAYVPFFP